MARTVRKSRKQVSKLSNTLNSKKINLKLTSIVFAFLLIGTLFVWIRMSGIEQDYAYNKIYKESKKESLENKELQAKKAKMLSVKNLKKFANKFKLKEPKDSQVIIIP